MPNLISDDNVISSDVEVARELIDELGFTNMEKFITYALGRAKKTNFDVQRLAGLRQYVASFRELEAKAVAKSKQRQAEHKADMRKLEQDAYDEGRVLIVNLSKGTLGEENAHLLGAFIITKLAQAAFARADTREADRRLFYLYADEFQDYASNGFMRILSQARNFSLALTLGHQFLGQLTDSLRQAVLGNAASFVSFRIGAEDAPLIARHLALEPEIEYSGMGSREIPPGQRLVQLANYTAWARFLVDHQPTEALHLDMLPPPPPINQRPHRAVTNSRTRFGRDRAAVEAKIARFLAGA